MYYIYLAILSLLIAAPAIAHFGVRIGTVAPWTCEAAAEGRMFYDTNAGTAANPGRLCVCDDDAGGYKWHPVERNVPGDAGVPVNLTGNSTTDCGT